MIIYKTKEEVELIRESCLLVSATITEIAKLIKPGITTLYLDGIVEQFIKDNGGIPAFKNYHGFPFNACISVNDAVVHGFPNNNVLKEGDVVSMDIGVIKHGFYGDSAYTFAINGISDNIKSLLRVTKEALYKGIEKAVVNNRVGDISFAVQEHTERKYGYGVVRELVGHGLGRDLHEEPNVPNYGKRGTGPKLKEGLVIAIEPMINLGKKEVLNDSDGWTIKTRDRLPSAHYEHTICVTKTAPDILSTFKETELAEKANENLCSDYY